MITEALFEDFRLLPFNTFVNNAAPARCAFLLDTTSTGSQSFERFSFAGGGSRDIVKLAESFETA